MRIRKIVAKVAKKMLENILMFIGQPLEDVTTLRNDRRSTCIDKDLVYGKLERKIK